MLRTQWNIRVVAEQTRTRLMEGWSDSSTPADSEKACLVACHFEVAFHVLWSHQNLPHLRLHRITAAGSVIRQVSSKLWQLPCKFDTCFMYLLDSYIPLRFDGSSSHLLLTNVLLSTSEG